MNVLKVIKRHTCHAACRDFLDLASTVDTDVSLTGTFADQYRLGACVVRSDGAVVVIDAVACHCPARSQPKVVSDRSAAFPIARMDEEKPTLFGLQTNQPTGSSRLPQPAQTPPRTP
jgi:hypothetical protein